MSDPILHYLIVFDRKTLGREILEFGEDIQAALAAYAQKEDEYESDSAIEVVLVGSDSIESVKATHGRYFPEKPVTNGWLADYGLVREATSDPSLLGEPAPARR